DQDLAVTVSAQGNPNVSILLNRLIQLPPCPADLNHDGKVNIDDLFLILGAWGLCDGCPEDLNSDGKVNIDDLFAVLGAWGPCPG
ncbi:MAG: hypothetical protein JSV91_13110, partial [Phycisphaerales bacterium]